jgi:single-strand DNA-binding protein
LNNFVGSGNITRELELRYTQSGKAVISFTIAINEGKDRTTFVDITAFGDTAEFVSKWFTKGKPIEVVGRLNQERWTDKESGQNRSKLGVIAEKVNFVHGVPKAAEALENRTEKPVKVHNEDESDQIPF